MKAESRTRTERLIGLPACERLQAARVIVFGIGGVGSFTCEALARAGVGTLTLVDPDQVAESNINRQLVALNSTLGQNKVDVMRARMLDINPDATVTACVMRYTAETADEFDLSQYDYVIDAIDQVPSKVELIVRAKHAGTPIVCAMGAGNKLDPSQFSMTDLFKTKNCPLARIMRKKLRPSGITSVDVVFSPEFPYVDVGAHDSDEAPKPGCRAPASISFVPSVAGLIMAGHVIRNLAEVQ